MSQYRFDKFKDGLISFKANEKYAGIIPAAPYCGFDVIASPSGLSFQLAHTNTGSVFTNENLSLSNKLGIWVTKQGVVVKETASIPLSIITNAGNASERIDLLVGNHNHDVIVEGGVAATYEIIKGALNNSSIPALTSPGTQTILGYLYIPAGTALASNINYVRAPVPSLGGKLPAYIDEVNRFTQQQQWDQGDAVIIANTAGLELAGRGIISALNGGNLFNASGFGYLDLLPDKPAGTQIQISFLSATVIRGFTDQLVGGVIGLGVRTGYSNGLRPIVLSGGIDKNITIAKYQIATFVKVNTTLTYTATTQPIYGDYWKLVSVGDSPIRSKELQAEIDGLEQKITDLETSFEALELSTAAKPFTVLMINLETPANYFNLTGLGIANTVWEGWHLCNGLNNTPNMGGLFPVGYQPSHADYGAVGNTGGFAEVTLNTAQIPAHKHYIPGSVENDFDGAGDVATNNGEGGLMDTESGGDTANTGGGQPHENRPPFRVLVFAMKLP